MEAQKVVKDAEYYQANTKLYLSYPISCPIRTGTRSASPEFASKKKSIPFQAIN